jgi:transcriptional regulator with XRE-family HTH domain
MCVAWNLRRARARRGWTQEEAAERLEPYIGTRWSKAAFSAAERSVEGERVRHFTADNLFAFARTFDLPVGYFLCPPPWATEIGHADGSETASAEEHLDLLFDLGEDAREWLLGEVVPMTAESTRALRRWGIRFAAMVAHREGEVRALAAAAEVER